MLAEASMTAERLLQSTVDYSDTAEVYAYALLLARYYERYTCQDHTGDHTRIVHILDREASRWLREVESLLTGGPIAAVPDLLEAHDLIHRFRHHSQPRQFHDAIRNSTVERWLSGDRTLTDTHIVLLLWPMVTAGTATHRYMDFCLSMQDEWINRLIVHGHFTGLPEIEAYRRLRHLLPLDLSAYIPGGRSKERLMKQRWTERHLADAPDALDTPTLREYILFIRTAVAHVYLPESETRRTLPHLTDLLLNRPGLHPLHRMAIQIGMENHLITQNA